MHYTLFVDESGDQGLDRVRSSIAEGGASPFLTLGGVLVPHSQMESLQNLVHSISAEFGKEILHCADLNHFQTAYFARIISTHRIKLFGVISKKSTLGEYGGDIKGLDQAQLYYNKCSQYLLELVGDFLGQHTIPASKFSIVFESKKHNYQRLRAYIRSIRKNPIDRRAVALNNIDPLSITDKSKSQEELLSIADLVAFSLFQSVNESKSNFGVPEERYLRELLRIFHREPKSGKVANFGIKYVKGPRAMNLSGQTLEFAQKQYKGRH
ncbi:DUF3800 domain-containing protein [Rhodophyticola porphyridii]|uniref:DUF3800 domain-containing protein n=1 Tax=Rhodophyticola porphyridii TaxID=1852017 RepID=UPI0035CF1F6E